MGSVNIKPMFDKHRFLKAKQATSQYSTSRGFTLIEVMVVVVIIAVMAAILIGNLSRDTDRIARFESERFIAVINEVRDEAIIAGENFLLSVDDRANNYQFSALRTTRNPTQDDGLFDTRGVNKEIKLDWEVFDQFDGEDEAKVLISSLGELTPFKIRFAGDDNDYYVFVNEENQLEREVTPSRRF